MRAGISAVAIACFALLAPIGSASPTAGHARHSVVLTGRVCDHVLILRSRHLRPPGATPLYMDAWVNGRRLLGWKLDGTLYLFGSSTLVQLPPGRALVIRAVRTIPHCARLRVAFTWRR